MKFKVGDKVKCMVSNIYLEYGKVYEVSNAFSGACDDYVNLVSEDDRGWSTSRFELVKEEVSMHKFKVGDVVKVTGSEDGKLSIPSECAKLTKKHNDTQVPQRHPK